MGFEKYIGELIATGGPIAAGIGIVLLVLIFGLKKAGVSAVFGDRKTLVDDEKLTAVQSTVDKIDEKIETVARRVSAVERDIEQRATREEVHEIKIALARHEGRMAVIEQIGKATNSAVERIETYMFEYGVQSQAARIRAQMAREQAAREQAAIDQARNEE
ncbi:hypothetical protein [Aureimonas sp. ME7]|uniref:hypothetical protein n=1 Tax=Aureimonas sp. ME7 TaxID=2744252 RepID=UPI0015F6EC85|nr:hypothetical protein [Aureimonas sp. ME7]